MTSLAEGEPATSAEDAVLTSVVTGEEMMPEVVISDEEQQEELENCSEVPPKISNESRHSIGAFSVPHTSRLAGASISLGTGGGRSNRPSQSENTLAKSQSEIQVNTTNSLSVSQTSKNSLMTYSSSGTFYDHSKKRADVRVPPKPVKPSNGKDATTDFRQMEQGLLQLLDDFHSGKLEAFGKGQNCTFEKMQNVREQQERLARLHFDLNAQQEICGQHTDEGIQMAKGNLSKLMENLQKLSLSIEQLQSGSLGGDDEK